MIEQTEVGAIDILRTSLGPLGPVVPEVNVYMPWLSLWLPLSIGVR